MRRRAYVIVCAVFVLAAITVLQRQAAAFTLTSIVQDAKEHYAKFLRAVKDIVIVQESVAAAKAGKLSSRITTMRKGKKFRIETKTNLPGRGQMPQMSVIVVYDGKNVWSVTPFLGKKLLSPEQAKDYKRNQHWTDWIGPGASLVGKEKVAGRQAYVIDVGSKSPDVPFTRIWVDTKWLEVVQGRFTSKSAKTMLFRSTDFRNLCGEFRIPYKTEILEDGKPLVTIMTKSVKTNANLSDDLFDPDKIKPAGPSFQDLMRGIQKGGPEAQTGGD